jgi:hypothetical protein
MITAGALRWWESAVDLPLPVDRNGWVSVR